MARRAPTPPRGAPVDRREFLRLLAAGAASAGLGLAGVASCGADGGGGDGGGAPLPGDGEPDAGSEDGGPEDGGPEDGGESPVETWGRVALVRTTDRLAGVAAALELLGLPLPSGRVALKANFNNAFPAPASTHPDVLRAVVRPLRAGGARVTLAERSGSANTRAALEALGIFGLAEELGFGITILDDLAADGWRLVRPAASHWSQGFPVARLFLEADAVVTCACLKTHAFGGHFTLSLKNSVGLVARAIPGEPHDYMHELHTSSYQRQMIAEINQAYRPALSVIDGVDAFVTGGPDQGTLAHPETILAGADRVALDAVGVALLRLHGAEGPVAEGTVWSQAQLARAAELGLGARGPDEVRIVTGDGRARETAEAVRAILAAT